VFEVTESHYETLYLLVQLLRHDGNKRCALWQPQGKADLISIF